MAVYCPKSGILYLKNENGSKSNDIRITIIRGPKLVYINLFSTEQKVSIV